jgi:hypothetical protein
LFAWFLQHSPESLRKLVSKYVKRQLILVASALLVSLSCQAVIGKTLMLAAASDFVGEHSYSQVPESPRTIPLSGQIVGSSERNRAALMPCTYI